MDPARESISFLGDVTLSGEHLAGREDRRILIGAGLAEQLELGMLRTVGAVACSSNCVAAAAPLRSQLASRQ